MNHTTTAPSPEDVSDFSSLTGKSYIEPLHFLSVFVCGGEDWGTGVIGTWRGGQRSPDIPSVCFGNTDQTVPDVLLEHRGSISPSHKHLLESCSLSGPGHRGKPVLLVNVAERCVFLNAQT